LAGDTKRREGILKDYNDKEAVKEAARLAAVEKEKNNKLFRETTAEKKTQLETVKDTHQQDFFGSFGLSPDELNQAFTTEACNGVQQMYQPARRLQLARLYAYSQGDSLDAIFADTPAGKELRERRGKEFAEILTKPDNVEAVGKMYADMGNAIANMPAPDISSDNALSSNMREIRFMSDSITMFTSMIQSGSQKPVYDKMVEKAGDNWQAIDKSTDIWPALTGLGILGRQEFISSTLYSSNPATEQEVAATNGVAPGALMYVDNRTVDYRNTNFPKPGQPLKTHTMDVAGAAMVGIEAQGDAVKIPDDKKGAALSATVQDVTSARQQMEPVPEPEPLTVQDISPSLRVVQSSDQTLEQPARTVGRVKGV
ncbi:MAG: hypothetical protein FWE68_03635, partial [Defluviitaleaceae bacterium]|nr:hypothetical protein [Defluviitaleaceae bacterium]